MASFDLYRELDNLRREMDEAFRGTGSPRSAAMSPLFSAHRSPPANLGEDENNLYLDVMIPGVDPKSAEVTVLRNTVTVSGERKPALEQRGQIPHRQELWRGRFSRAIELPVEVDAERISAVCKDGIMRITMPKAAHEKPRRIEIAAA
ncbi:Hsp20/alpha crystallin family protein [Geomesophilobacter sediminis]|uniref:Hsp20/alpha crystallin family protein n=1 Tax=Geomesophilobacter sediminis TaxID=2798584 RepID=A0A8J7JJP3_9BACT|nr:Hsp20/alpha crystallin family protein [Geomesophilobacter sediminis]MBJ6723125.1 Hsp20/alpha crystallin family protein [Geomesophilobacter sediminis]